jgi:hypothetical protein
LYDPALGRWDQPDPAANVDGTDLYAAMNSDPVTCVDPFGLDAGNIGAIAPNPLARPHAHGTQSVPVKSPSGCDGTLTILTSPLTDPNPDRSGHPEDKIQASTRVELSITFDKNCDCGCDPSKLKWHQSVRISILNQGNLSDAEIAQIEQAETAQHGGHDPFTGWVGDNASGNPNVPYPWNEATGAGMTMADGPTLPEDVYPNRGGVHVLKMFDAEPYCNGTPLGIHVSYGVDIYQGLPRSTNISTTVTGTGT